MSFIPSTNIREEVSKGTEVAKDNVSKSYDFNSLARAATSTANVPQGANTLIIGLIALDTISTLHKKPIMGDSNPGTLRSSVGGVGFNVSLAHKYAILGSKKSYRFISPENREP